MGYNRQANPSREIPRLFLLRMTQENRGKWQKIGENLRELSWANTPGGRRVEFSFWAIAHLIPQARLILPLSHSKLT